ncbi:MAG: RsmB/NOP family class I SAM-dependent RNA methyltransferase [Alphaproteobacteria bacterium]|nr:RsmB/NOP family class I SAM-dependent RNA methyltransferase [Alphaproteobacteria bacterium]
MGGARQESGQGAARKGDPARAGALGLIRGVLEGGAPIGDQIAAGGLGALDPRGRARAQRLALGALRGIAAAEAALAPHLARKPEPALRALLILAASEVLMSPEAAHGAVAAAVDLARALPGGAAKAGFVNAVLRRVAAAPARPAPPPELPGWMRARLVARFGAAPVEATEAVFAQPEVPLDLTLRDPGTAAAWAGATGAELLPTGGLRLGRAGQVSALPGYAEGAWWVQDAGAAAVAGALGPVAGRDVLDLCAAPGGKTMQLAAAGARVVAVDPSARRMARLAENLARTGLRARCVTADALTADLPRADAVLLDAPCTATGTIRRHPELPLIRREADLAALVALQAALIDRALALAVPGGVVVYATCSLLPDEGEAQIAAARARARAGLCPAFETEPIAPPPGLPDAATPEGFLRIWPHHWAARGGIDGFFVARLRRVADAPP